MQSWPADSKKNIQRSVWTPVFNSSSFQLIQFSYCFHWLSTFVQLFVLLTSLEIIWKIWTGNDPKNQKPTKKLDLDKTEFKFILKEIFSIFQFLNFSISQFLNFSIFQFFNFSIFQFPNIAAYLMLLLQVYYLTFSTSTKLCHARLSRFSYTIAKGAIFWWVLSWRTYTVMI